MIEEEECIGQGKDAFELVRIEGFLRLLLLLQPESIRSRPLQPQKNSKEWNHSQDIK